MLFEYEEPVFRPPSEAYSLIIQATIGCSWNKCAFCEMYTKKKFRVRKIEDVIDEIKEAGDLNDEINKIFLADGNAFCLSTDKLLLILKAIKDFMPKVRRVLAYALPSDISRKSSAELSEISDAGLKLLYVGIESGDDALLKMINKGESYQSTVQGLIKAQNAGINNSVMIINGLGGKLFSEQHAINSAKILNEIQPYYASTLVLSFPFGLEQFATRFQGDFQQLSQIELLKELKIFISNLDLKQTIFRSDHASNYLVIKGNLSRDKERFLKELDFAITNPNQAGLRAEWMRGL